MTLRRLILFLALLAACSPQPPVPRLGAQPLGSESATPAAAPAAPDFVALVKREGVSVVNVSSTRTVRRPEGPVPGLSPEDPLYEMFRRLLPPVPREYQA
ncbi:MAG TPA: hypothetical protein VEV21_01660, partial [Burkholderiales bacterium]|nr:hypothetical protein [Burkholderiales bacterium]